MISDPSPSSGSSRAPSRDDESFSKTEHLLKTGYFKRVYNKGRAVRRAGAALFYLSNTQGTNRIGFVIASRNVKLATRRNKIRRIFRECYRRNKAALKTGFDLVLVVKKEPRPEEFSYSNMKKAFLDMAKAAGLLK